MAVALEGSRAIVARAKTFVIIFGIAGYAAGSCLSYGHACWGAHGKRSSSQGLHLLPTKSIDALQQQDQFAPGAAMAKEQWILSRLIDGRSFVPVPDKYRERWPLLRTDRRFVNQLIPRDRNENEKDSIERRVEDIPNEATPEVILVSRAGYDEGENNPRNIDLFRLLTKDSENF